MLTMMIELLKISLDGIKIIDPVSYFEMLCLEKMLD